MEIKNKINTYYTLCSAFDLTVDEILWLIENRREFIDYVMEMKDPFKMSNKDNTKLINILGEKKTLPEPEIIYIISITCKVNSKTNVKIANDYQIIEEEEEDDGNTYDKNGEIIDPKAKENCEIFFNIPNQKLINECIEFMQNNYIKSLFGFRTSAFHIAFEKFLKTHNIKDEWDCEQKVIWKIREIESEIKPKVMGIVIEKEKEQLPKFIEKFIIWQQKVGVVKVNKTILYEFMKTNKIEITATTQELLIAELKNLKNSK